MNKSDEVERLEVAWIVEALPNLHPALIALENGKSTVQVLYTLRNEPALLEQIKQVHARGVSRRKLPA